MDNRNHDTTTLDEIINDDTPIDEGQNPKEPDDIQPVADSPDDVETFETPEEDQPEEEETPAKPAPTPEPDKRYQESTREAQLLAEQNKQLLEGLSQTDSVLPPTEQELRDFVRQDGADYDMLTPFEVAQAKRNLVNERKLSLVSEAVKKVKDADAWAGKVDGFLDTNETSQQYKLLVGRDSEFRSFAMKPTHRGVPLEILVPAFLHEVPLKQTKGSMLLTRNGGEKIERKTSVDDAERVAQLRTSDPKRYKELLRSDKIKIDL